MSSGFLAWHPDVHERFGERLFFFLLALRSFNEKELGPKLQQLMGGFGVATERGHEGYCSYVVLGEFDHLLRVWLPADMDTKFIQQARQILPVETVLQFTVQNVISDWRFQSAPNASVLSKLDRAEVARVQRVRTEAESLGLCRDGVAYWVPQGGKKARKGHTADPIKAFICMKAPEKVSDQMLTAVQQRLIQYINSAAHVDHRTVYRGVGFAWLLAKVVADDFHALSALVRGISNEFGEFGVSTNTYAATYHFAEGDNIREEALTSAKTTTEQVAQLCPGLRDHERLVGELGAGVRNAVSNFIEHQVLPASLGEADQRSMAGLLEAVLWDSEEQAMEALYLPTVRTERAIRDPLLKLAEQSEGGIKNLIRVLEERKQEVKGAGTITLGACLLGAREYIRMHQPDFTLAIEFSEEEIRTIAKTRNRLMHGAPLKLKEEWPALAEYLLSLFRARKVFATALDESLRALEKTA